MSAIKKIIAGTMCLLVVSAVSEETFAQDDVVEGRPPAEDAVSEAAGTEEEVAPSSAYDDLVSLAEDHFERREYGEALAALERAYAVDPNPNLLYNQARIYEAMGELEKALEMYESFAVAPGVDLEYRRETLERIKVLKEAVALKNAKEKPPEEEETVALTPPPEEREEGRSGVPFGAILVTTGSASLVVGGIFGSIARSEHQQFEEATTLAEKRTHADRVETFAPVADGLFLAGGLLVTSGLIAIAIKSSRKREANALRVLPSATRDGAGVHFGLTF